MRIEKEILNDFDYDEIINNENELVLEKRYLDNEVTRIRIDKLLYRASKVNVEYKPYTVRALYFYPIEIKLLYELYIAWGVLNG